MADGTDDILRSHLSGRCYEALMAVRIPKVHRFVAEAIVLCEPREVFVRTDDDRDHAHTCLLYTSPSPRDLSTSRMPSSA